ncbi:MAG TPA: dihydrofolate synthase [Prevotella sp.]|nr:dihydrofolate synthase [Prevotella sp.]
MTYKETVEYLFNSTPVFEKIGASAYKEGLDNTHQLDEHFNHPHQLYKTIHVAGTNGKGSVSHTLASILQSQGLKVGLYTSPHLVDFRERIRINGKCISEKYVVDFVAQNRDFFEPLHPSFFELTTALAFKYFADQKVDIAVIEVGLGGRLDCTNIIKPAFSIITNISFDHTQFLGNTLAKIAAEKAGIIKPHVPVIIGETTPETKLVFKKKADEMHAPIIYAEELKEVTNFEMNSQGGIDYLTIGFGDLHGELSGEYQVKNTNTILCTADIMLRKGLIKDKKYVYEGLAHVCKNTGLMGRWQQLKDKPYTVCDTGHNVGGWIYLSEQIKEQQAKNKRIIFGMVDDKDIDTVMDMLPKDAFYYWTQCSSKRSFPLEKVVEIGTQRQLHGKGYSSVIEAYEAAQKEADPEDFIFVGGSSYVVADLFSALQRQDSQNHKNN